VRRTLPSGKIEMKMPSGRFGSRLVARESELIARERAVGDETAPCGVEVPLFHGEPVALLSLAKRSRQIEGIVEHIAESGFLSVFHGKQNSTHFGPVHYRLNILSKVRVHISFA
jgi:hypothetical protein